jgi:PPOX class probable F420-dependent enzyme
VSLDADVLGFIRDGNFAMMTTLFADGTPQTQVMWVDADDDHVLINTEVDRQKHLNVQRDPRVTVTVWDGDNPYRYVEVRGRVVEQTKGPDARGHIDTLAQRYMGKDYPEDNIGTERVILRIEPDRVLQRGF